MNIDVHVTLYPSGAVISVISEDILLLTFKRKRKGKKKLMWREPLDCKVGLFIYVEAIVPQVKQFFSPFKSIIMLSHVIKVFIRVAK